MSKSNVVSIDQVERPEDALTEVLRRGSRLLLCEAIEAEVESFLVEYQDQRTAVGHRRLVRNGYMPEREIQTGIGGISVKVPRVRDRQGELHFRSNLVPPYLRRSKSIADLLPWLYLRGISTGDFSRALEALVGPEAPGLSSSTARADLLIIAWDLSQSVTSRSLNNRLEPQSQSPPGEIYPLT